MTYDDRMYKSEGRKSRAQTDFGMRQTKTHEVYNQIN